MELLRARRNERVFVVRAGWVLIGREIGGERRDSGRLGAVSRRMVVVVERSGRNWGGGHGVRGQVVWDGRGCKLGCV